MELIARIIGEDIKKLCQAFVNMNLDYFDAEINLKINDQWVQISPEMISGEYDIIIDVGAGTGTKEYEFQQMMQMLNIYQGVGQALGPMAFQVFDINAIKNMVREMWTILGRKNPDKFLAPDMPPGMPPGIGGQIGPAVGQGTPGGGGGPSPMGPPAPAAMPPGNGGVPQGIPMGAPVGPRRAIPQGQNVGRAF
jgi:hypothetical protein